MSNVHRLCTEGLSVHTAVEIKLEQQLWKWRKLQQVQTHNIWQSSRAFSWLMFNTNQTPRSVQTHTPVFWRMNDSSNENLHAITKANLNRVSKGEILGERRKNRPSSQRWGRCTPKAFLILGGYSLSTVFPVPQLEEFLLCQTEIVLNIGSQVSLGHDSLVWQGNQCLELKSQR